jgi:hypothetical protein
MNEPTDLATTPTPPAPSLPPPPPPSPVADAPHKYSGWAIASLVAGVLTWFSAPLFFLVVPTPLCTLAAIVCGHIARAQLRREPGLEGHWMAVAGLVLGWSMVLTMVLIGLVVLLVFGGIAAFLAYFGH